VTTEAKTGETDAVAEPESEAIEATEGTEATEATEVTDDPAGQESDPQADSGKRGRLRPVHKRVGAILLVLALLASAGVAAWLYFFQYRPDQQVNADAARVAVDAASTGTIAILSYSPDTLEQDFTAAKSHLTGDFLNYYTQFTEQIVTPAAKEKSVKTTASVVQAAVSELHPDSAVVLVFINQTTTSKENPDGAFAASAVKVGMKKIDGRWLIDAFDPV
jgi:Mce-associated membrane protein